MGLEIFAEYFLYLVLRHDNKTCIARNCTELRRDLTLVGRTLIPTNFYVYPCGMQKQGMPQGHTYYWKSKYCSVLDVSYDGGVRQLFP